MLERPPAGRWPRWIRSGPAAALALVVAGLTGTFVTVAQVQDQQDVAADAAVDRQAETVADAVTVETNRYVDTLRSVAAATGAIDQLTTAKFAQLSAPLRSMRLAGATSIAFMVPTAEDQIAATRELWRSRGEPGLELNAAATGPEHIFSVLSEPLDGSTVKPLGVDATQAAAPSRALDEARRTGEVTVSDTYQLLVDHNLPVEQRQMSFVLTAPVHGPSGTGGGAAAERSFKGWVLMGLRGQDFIGGTLARAGRETLDVTLAAHNSDDALVRVATQISTVAGPRAPSRHRSVQLAQRAWELEVTAVASTLAEHTVLPAGIAAGGALSTVLVAALVLILVGGRARARAQVLAATGELRTTEADARAQTELLETILDSISDGVGVVDEHGEFLRHNVAAKVLLGVDEDRSGGEHWQEHYGMFLPDGHTPFPPEAMPLMRALAGETSDQVGMVIRNASHPDGVVITVSAQPLHKADGHVGAVAVFHDVTAQHRAELALRRDHNHSEAIAAVAATIAATSADTQAIAETISTELASRIGDQAGFLLFDAESGRLDILSSVGADAEFAESSRQLLLQHPPHIDDTAPGTVAETARTRTTANVAYADPAARAASLPEPYRSFAVAHPIHHLLHVPLLDGDSLLGVITVVRLHPQPFDAHDISLVEDVAVRASYALAHAHLFELKDRAEQALRESNERLEELANSANRRALRDPLTDLLNRSALIEQLVQAVARAARRVDTVAVLYVDLDQFKTVNDTLGHAGGDELLRQVSHRLLQAVRTGDTVARIGGDEFVVILDPVQDAAEAVAIAERTQRLLGAPYRLTKAEAGVCTASVGIALAAAHETADALLQRADEALYEAKRAGRDTSRLHGDRSTAAHGR